MYINTTEVAFKYSCKKFTKVYPVKVFVASRNVQNAELPSIT